MAETSFARLLMSDLPSLSERNQAFLLLAALKEGDKAVSLLPYLGEAAADKMKGPLEELLKIPKEKLKGEVQSELGRLSQGGKESLFKHADAGWILENFRNEAPRVLFLILRELPKAKAGRVLRELPKETRKALKGLKFSKVPLPIVHYLHRQWEQKFPSIAAEQLQDNGPFEKLTELKSDQLLALMREVGIHEMSVAFSKVNRSATRAILHRMSVKDAKELRQRIKDAPEYKLELQREAQLNILGLDLEKLNAEELVLEIGFSVFSRTFSREHLSLAPFFIYKLAPRQGYILKRYVDQNAAGNSPEKAQRVRDRVLEALIRIQAGL